MVCDKLGYDDERMHGGGQSFVNMTKGLIEAGIDVKSVVLRSPGTVAARLSIEGLQFSYLKRRKFDPLILLDLIHLIRSQRSQLIHAAGGYGSAAFCRLAAIICHIPVIVHIREDHICFPAQYPGWVGLIDRFLSPKTSLCIAVSEAAARSAIELQHFRKEKLQVLHNMIDINNFKPVSRDVKQSIRREIGIPPSASVAICVTRFFPVKGVDQLIKAWSMVIQQANNSHLLIVGDGPLRLDLERAAASLGLDGKAHFLGYRSDVEYILQAGDFLVIPSRSEALGLCAIEAMAVGLPVVAFRVGGIPEVVQDGVNGLLAESGNIMDLSDKILMLIRDRHLCTLLGEAGLARAKDYGISAYIQKLVKHYKSLVNGSPQAQQIMAK
jgi:glycosyltransferase involved in cell wall biosynthesis